MRLPLKLHPDSTSAAASSIEVDVVAHSQDGIVMLSYVVLGNVSNLQWPSVVTPTRADELWRHPCFEAFLTVPPAPPYYEFNFSPSTQWAAYRFTDYRKGMEWAADISTPNIEIATSPEKFSLSAALHLKELALPQGKRPRLGLSAVIEETNGNKSYWALSHPPGKPDFHRADCFTHELS